jgi:NADH-quinone oxidoreductase subunit M
MFTHGTITGLLFIMVGLVYDRAHTRQIADFGGLMHHVPLIGVVMLVAGLASLGLPGLSGFVAELTVFLGSFGGHPFATILAIFGVVLAAGYILWMVERVFMGPPNPRWASMPDATAWWERTAMAGMVASIVIVGIFPAILMDVVEVGIAPIATLVGAGVGAG